MIANGFTISLSPCTILKTPSGKPASFNNSANLPQLKGTFSDGLMIMQFPSAMALGNGPVRNHAWKIKRNDGSNNTQRHMFCPAFNSFAYFQYFTRYQLRQRSGKFCQLNTFFNFSHCFAIGLAIFFLHKFGKFFQMFFQ